MDGVKGFVLLQAAAAIADASDGGGRGGRRRTVSQSVGSHEEYSPRG